MDFGLGTNEDSLCQEEGCGSGYQYFTSCKHSPFINSCICINIFHQVLTSNIHVKQTIMTAAMMIPLLSLLLLLLLFVTIAVV